MCPRVGVRMHGCVCIFTYAICNAPLWCTRAHTHHKTARVRWHYQFIFNVSNDTVHLASIIAMHRIFTKLKISCCRTIFYYRCMQAMWISRFILFFILFLSFWLFIVIVKISGCAQCSFIFYTQRYQCFHGYWQFENIFRSQNSRMQSIYKIHQLTNDSIQIYTYNIFKIKKKNPLYQPGNEYLGSMVT